MNKNKIQLFALFVILVGFPLTSWYYLKTGFDYQMDARAELKDYGNIPQFSFIDMNGVPLSKDSINSKMTVLSFLGKDEAVNKEVLEVVNKLNQQFGDNQHLKLMVGGLNSEKYSKEKLQQLYTSYNYQGDQVLYFTNSKSSIQDWAGKQIKVPVEWLEKENEAPDIRLEASKSTLIDYPFFVVADTKHKIRNFYHAQKLPEVQRMVEHIALLLPREVELDAVYVPEKEK